MILIIVKNKKYKDIPITQFHFDLEENLLQSIKELKKYNYLINYRLNPENITESTLTEITGLSLKDFESKELLFKYYKKNLEEDIFE